MVRLLNRLSTAVSAVNLCCKESAAVKAESGHGYYPETEIRFFLGAKGREAGERPFR
jgi:hypothetical protein